MTRQRDREASAAGLGPVNRRGRDDVLAELVASTGRCVANAIKWGAEDVEGLRVLVMSDESCLALRQCVSRYARLLCEAGETAERTLEIVLASIDLASVDVVVQDCIRDSVRDWTIDAWSGGGRAAVRAPGTVKPLASSA